MSEATQVESASVGCDHYSKSVNPDVWWEAHFDQATGEILGFFSGDGISLEGKRVADVGCGDGITDFGLTVRGNPAYLVGFDVEPTDVDALTEFAQQHLGIEKLPDALTFVTCGETSLPADDNTFDVVVSWSAFEHIADARAVLKEIHRVLTDDGVLFIQLWPFYDSAHGTHLVDWFPEGFAQFTYSDDEILRRVRSTGDQQMAAEMLEIYRTLNRITLDELHQAIRDAGFKPVKVAVSADAVHIPDSAAHLPLSRTAISGVKLLAIPDNRASTEPDAAQTSAADTTEVEPGAVEPGAVEPGSVEPGAEQPDPSEPLSPSFPAPTPTTTARVARSVRPWLAKLDDILSRYDVPSRPSTS
jgi:ubiquinone/menaquinone biosynthesis C-methylase UbiE